MVRIRPGRSWRINPGYVGQLQALSGPHARRFDAGSILDVVGIEIDGVDIAAGIGEAQVLLAVAELAEALVRLGEGAPAAQATVGPGPTDVLLETRGAEVTLSLVLLERPARLLASGLMVDGARLRAAALQAAEGLLGDLLDISLALRSTPVCKRLVRAAQLLAKKPHAQAQPWPPAARPAHVRSLVLRGGSGGLRCELQLPHESAERLAAPIAFAPLASLLSRGTLALRIPGAPAVAFEAPLYLALRDAVHSAAALVHAWEAGDRTFELELGPTQLRFDLTRDEVRAAGWTRPAQAPPAQVALALAAAARTFATRALKLALRGAPVLEPLRDLSDAAGELVRHCRDLSSGALRRAPELVSAPPLLRPPPREQRPLQKAGQVRRLLFRESFRARLPEQPAALFLCGRDPAGPLAAGGAIWTLNARDARGLDLETGLALPTQPCAGPRAAARASAGGDLFVLGPEALVRLDGATGQVRWRRKMPAGQGPLAALFALPSGVLVSTRGSLILVADDGQVAWRARLEQTPEHVLAHESMLCLSLPGGMAGALDAGSGRALWRRRLGARSGPPALCEGRVLVVAEAAGGAARLHALDAASGQPAWEVDLPAPAVLRAPVVSGEEIAVLAGEGIHCMRGASGALRFFAALPWSGAGHLTAVEEPEEPSAPARRPRLRGAAWLAAGPGGSLALIEGAGTLGWELAPEGETPASPPRLLRGVAISAAAGLRLCDAQAGVLIAQLGSRAPDLWAAAPDLTVAICESTELVVYRLAAHLSIV